MDECWNEYPACSLHKASRKYPTNTTADVHLTQTETNGKSAATSHVISITPLGPDIDTGLMYKEVTDITKDGLTWGEADRVEMSHGCTMLRIKCTITNPQLTIEDVQEDIEAIEDLVNITYLE